MLKVNTSLMGAAKALKLDEVNLDSPATDFHTARMPQRALARQGNRPCMRVESMAARFKGT